MVQINIHIIYWYNMLFKFDNLKFRLTVEILDYQLRPTTGGNPHLCLLCMQINIFQCYK